MRVGSLVECIDDTFPAYFRQMAECPVKGQYYYVRAVVKSYIDPSKKALLLEEITNGRHPQTGYEFGFLEYHFKEVGDIDVTMLLEEFELSNN